MAMIPQKKKKEFWGLMAAAFVFYLISMFVKAEDLNGLLIVASAILFVIALVRLKGSS